jgi:hypothetical protein
MNKDVGPTDGALSLPFAASNAWLLSPGLMPPKIGEPTR